MAQQTKTTKSRPGFSSLPIPNDIHREMQIAKAYRGQELKELVRAAWEAFKREQGDRIHEQVTRQAVA